MNCNFSTIEIRFSVTFKLCVRFEMQDELLESLRLNTNDNINFSCFFRLRFYADFGSFAYTIICLQIAKKAKILILAIVMKYIDLFNIKIL